MGSREEWEYKTLKIGSEGPMGLSKTSEDPESKLNSLGQRGWEMTGQINMENGATQLLILKRPKLNPRTCPECGEKNPPNAGHCGSCGNEFN
jgi:ribosomal protein L40E